jgi:hypothetical protein
MMTLQKLKHVRKQPGFLAEGHLYAHGGDFFLVFTAGEGRTWDACVSDASGGHMADFVVRGAASRRECIERLQRALDAQG